jgi:hypothetical protein
MSTIDEAWNGDLSDYVPSVSTLCSRAPLAGKVTYEHLRVLTMDDRSRWVWLGMLALLVVAIAVLYYNFAHAGSIMVCFVASCFFNFIANSALIEWYNRGLSQKFHECLADPLTVSIKNEGDIQNIVTMASRGAFMAFKASGELFKHFETVAEYASLIIRRDDDMGAQVVFFKFSDDHDRVMFVLGS